MALLLALSPSLLWGSMGIILMKLGGNSRQQTMGQVMGGVLVGIVLAVIVGIDPDPAKTLIAFLAGVLTAIAIHFQLSAFHYIGVSRVMPLTTGGQLVGISLLGVLLFGEWIGTPALPVGLIAVAMVTIGVLLTAWTEKQTTSSPIPASVVQPGESAQLGYSDEAVSGPVDTSRPSASQMRIGIIETLICTAFFIAAPLVIRWFDVDPVKGFLPQSIGWIVMGTIVTFPIFTPRLGKKDDRWSKYTVRAMLPGAMWAIGVVIMQFSQANVGVAIGFSLSQLGVVVSTFGGIWFLGERRTRKEMAVITVGVIALVIGALLLGLAKSLDGS